VFGHIFRGPNAQYGEDLFFQTVAQRAAGVHALELGCGNGGFAERLIHETDAAILATDISTRQVDQAQARAVEGRLEFRELNAEGPVDGRYDLIYGRGVLHHIDFRPALERLANDNLHEGGAMVFREPLGANVMGAVYRQLSRDDHTEDERPISRDDLLWFKRTFKGFWFYPYGLASLPLGAISSPMFKDANNPLTRLGHRLDDGLLRHIGPVRSLFRAAVLVIDPS
jgi:SAM-dependent methyltransferase